MESAGLFNQWQLITNVRSQLNKRISLNGFYMYGRAYSNTDGVNTLPASPYSMAGEYGPSALDQRNRGFIGGTITGPWALLFAPFITMNTGAPFNITTGTDPFGTTLFNERPGISPTPTKYLFDGLYLDPNPIAADGTIKPGETLLPRNFGRSPGNISVNLRIAKTFGFGGSRESSARNNNNQNGGGGQGGGNFGGGGGRGPGGGGPGGGPGGGFAGGPGGGGPGGFFRGLNGGGSTGQRYNLTISVQARNLLNHVNPGPINGIVSSPLFDESNTLAGGFGAFAQSGLNRRIDLQARFTF
jgi:hypothetical protein